MVLPAVNTHFKKFSFFINFYKNRWQTDKPDSVVDNHSSRRTITHAFKQPTRILSGQLIGYLFGLATRGVYLAMNCCQSCGGLLPHRFTLTQPLNQIFLQLQFFKITINTWLSSRAVYSLLHWS